MRDSYMIKAGCCRILANVYVNRDPYRAMALPRYYRGLDSSLSPTSAPDDVRHFPCSTRASELEHICSYATTYIEKLSGTTKMWQVRQPSLPYRHAGLFLEM